MKALPFDWTAEAGFFDGPSVFASRSAAADSQEVTGGTASRRNAGDPQTLHPKLAETAASPKSSAHNAS